MAQPSSCISNARSACLKVIEAVRKAEDAIGEYNAIGGESGVAPFWLDPEGEPRTDLDITQAEFVSGIVSLQAFAALFGQGHNTNLYKAKG